jgi:hypothetical protein
MVSFYSVYHWLNSIASNSAQPGYAGTDFGFSFIGSTKTFLTQLLVSIPLIANIRGVLENWHLGGGVFDLKLPIHFPTFINAALIITVGVLLFINRAQLLKTLSSLNSRPLHLNRPQWLLLLATALFPMSTYAVSRQYILEIPRTFTFYSAYGVLIFLALFIFLFCLTKFRISKYLYLVIISAVMLQSASNQSTSSLVNTKFETLKTVQKYLIEKPSPPDESCPYVLKIRLLNYAGNGDSTAEMLRNIFGIPVSYPIKSC